MEECLVDAYEEYVRVWMTEHPSFYNEAPDLP